jgi:hypothetical protein
MVLEDIYTYLCCRMTPLLISQVRQTSAGILSTRENVPVQQRSNSLVPEEALYFSEDSTPSNL